MGIFDWLTGKKKETAENSTAPQPPRGGPQPPQLDVGLDQTGAGNFTESVANFGLAMGRGQESNLICSAYSIYEAWLRVWAGSVGGSRTELDQAFGLSSEATVRQDHQQLLAAIETATGPGCELQTANTIFLRPNLPLHAEFEASWGGATQELDFSDRVAAAEVVNQWVREHTGGMIDKIVDPRTMSDATAMMIANAIYLDARWAAPFEAHHTMDSPFTLQDGTRVEVPTMVQMIQYECAATADFELLLKPYQGGHLAMAIVMPRPGRFETVRDNLQWAAVETVMDAREPLLTTLYLPKFSVESSPEVDPLIKSRGAASIYSTERADLSAMSPDARKPGEELCVGQTAHRARIDVDEEGTKAAAATVIELLAGSAPPRPYVFHVNRPFLYFIVERSTKTPLFSGQVVDPR